MHKRRIQIIKHLDWLDEKGPIYFFLTFLDK